MIRRRDLLIQQKREPLELVLVQVLGEPCVLAIAAPPRRQLSQPLRVLLVDRSPAVAVGLLFVQSVAQFECFGKQVDHLLRELLGHANMLVHQPAGTPQGVVDALLMDHILEAVIGRKAIVRHAPRPVNADDFLQDISAALAVDGVAGDSPIADPGVQPGEAAANAPTRLVRRQMLGVFDVLPDLRANGLEDSTRPQYDLRARSWGQLDAEELGERVGDLAVGQASMLVEVDHGRLGVAAELALGSADGVGSLQPMPATKGLAALFAVAAVDVELPRNGLARNLGLVLLIAVIRNDLTIAIRAAIGQGRFEDFVDRRGRWRRAVAMFAVLGAFFAAGLFGILFGLAFGEGSGLAFGGAFELFDALLEFVDGFLELGDELIALGKLRAEVLVFKLHLLQGEPIHTKP